MNHCGRTGTIALPRALREILLFPQFAKVLHEIASRIILGIEVAVTGRRNLVLIHHSQGIACRTGKHGAAPGTEDRLLGFEHGR
jgi:hypothetical protein